ncbi:MAG: Y-family DNA polymerase [Chlamydiota bacterium]
MLLALVDCNNFYASCERVFNPLLEGKPIVILSNNDGCIIARSNEAKALGIPMGAPLFEYRELIKKHGVVVCSSNYALYGDMSQRVMEVLEMNTPEVQVYSIDESFLDFDVPNPIQEAKSLRATIKQWTGIPVSIGIAKTKTLAKVANHIAKKNPEFCGVFYLDEKNSTSILQKFPVEDVWGIGRRYAEKLIKQGIKTALDLRDTDDTWIKKHMTVVGLRTVWELRGTSCIPLEEAPSAKQSITSSRAFGRPITELDELYESVASYAARAAEKARKEKRLASSMFVFFVFHPFRSGGNNVKIIFPEPTSYTPEIIHYAKLAAHEIYRSGHSYRKAGVILEGLVDENSYQRDLFANKGPLQEKQKQAMALLDKMNRGFGHKTIHMAAEGLKKTWLMKQEQRSPRYTTRWDEIPIVKTK